MKVLISAFISEKDSLFLCGIEEQTKRMTWHQ
jgi:hypothetical protein